MVRANTLVDPPGSGASATSEPASPLMASLRVPSPPSTATTSQPSPTAPWARREAWPRRLVAARVTSWSAASAFWITTWVRAVTDEAWGFTSRRTFRPTTIPLPEPFSEVAWLCGTGGGVGDLHAMDIVVCVKQIPDPADPGELDSETKTLKRDMKLIMDESDSYGVEMALQLRDAAGEGEVTLVSMAPNEEVNGLRSALAMGADKAILVSDEALAGSDALGTARVLAAAISRADADLILAATESSDGYTGTVPEQVAELLGLPSVTFAKDIQADSGEVVVKRQTEAGYDEVRCPLPAVVSVTAGVVEPRYPSFKGIMAAKSKPMDQVGIGDLGISADQVGWAGGGQEITDVSPAPEREAGEIITDEGDAHERIIALLEELRIV